MNITAHKTEQMFLTYIGKEPIDYSVKLAKIWQKLGKKKKANQQKTDLKVIKTHFQLYQSLVEFKFLTFLAYLFSYCFSIKELEYQNFLPLN